MTASVQIFSTLSTDATDAVSQVIEYLVRIRFEEPPDNPATPAENRVGNAMADILGEIEDRAVDREIVSRTVVRSRVRCASISPDPTRHYATSRRWTIQPSDCEPVVSCSAACAVGWICSQLPADVTATPSERGPGA